MNENELKNELAELKNSLNVLMLELLKTKAHSDLVASLIFQDAERKKTGNGQKQSRAFLTELMKKYDDVFDYMSEIDPELALRNRKETFLQFEMMKQFG